MIDIENYKFNVGDLVKTTYHHHHNESIITPDDFGVIVERWSMKYDINPAYKEKGIKHCYAIYFQNCGKKLSYKEEHIVLAT